MRHNHQIQQFIAMLIVTLCVIFGKISASEAFLEGEPEHKSEEQTAQSDDPACANAIPLNDLRQVQIVPRGNYDGCVNKSRLLCSLEQSNLGEYDLDNIIRYTVARMPDGKCVRVNLADATIFSYSAKGLTEYSAARYLNPARPMPPGVLTFGAMPHKRTLYVRAEIDHCDPAQGGSLDKCEQERDALKIELHTLKSELGALKNATPSATAALPGPSPQTTARPGEESGLARSASGQSPPTPTTSDSAAPEGNADLMTAALNQQGQELTAIKNAIADCNSNSGKRVQINENGQPVCVATTATTSPDSVNIFLGLLIVLVLLLATLFVFMTQKASTYRGHLEAIRTFFSLDRALPYSGFAQGIEELALRDQENLKYLHLLPIAQAMQIEDKVETDTSPLIAAVKQLREKAEVAWKALANIRHELAINSGSDPVQAIKDLRAHHARDLETAHADLETAHADLETARADLDAARQQGDHSNCVPKDQHTDCVAHFIHLAQLEVAGTLLAEKDRIAGRYDEIVLTLSRAQEGLQCLIDHPKAKPESKKGQRIKKAVEAVLALIQSISAIDVPAPQAQA